MNLITLTNYTTLLSMLSIYLIIIDLIFFKCYRENSEKWLFNRLLKYEGIDDKKAECQRNLGNKCFAKKDYDESYQFYTKSLCYACRKGVNYGLALANRSALLYELGEFEVSSTLHWRT